MIFKENLFYFLQLKALVQPKMNILKKKKICFDSNPFSPWFLYHLIYGTNQLAEKVQSSKLNLQYLCHAIFKSWKFRWITSEWTAIASKAWSKLTEVIATVSIDFSGPWISHCFPRSIQVLNLFWGEKDLLEKVWTHMSYLPRNPGPL